MSNMYITRCAMYHTSLGSPYPCCHQDRPRWSHWIDAQLAQIQMMATKSPTDIWDIYIHMSWLWRSHPHISQPLIHICLKKNESHPSKSFFSYLNIFKLDPNCAPCCVQPPRHGEPRRFRAPGDSRAPPGQPGRGVLRTSSGFSAAMGHGMVLYGSKPYPPGEHQNSW